MSKRRNSKERIKKQTRKNTHAFKVKKWQLRLDTKNTFLIERIRTRKKQNKTNPNQNWYAVRKGLK